MNVGYLFCNVELSWWWQVNMKNGINF